MVKSAFMLPWTDAQINCNKLQDVTQSRSVNFITHFKPFQKAGY